jgi:hypothetical protein
MARVKEIVQYRDQRGFIAYGIRQPAMVTGRGMVIEQKLWPRIIIAPCGTKMHVDAMRGWLDPDGCDDIIRLTEFVKKQMLLNASAEFV